jgi:protein involved in polysaccharide export with SLBB domain
MVVLTRRATEEKPESESIVFDLGSKELPSLQDGDSIRVASREEYLPIIYIEGAISGDIVGISTRDQTVAQTNYAVLRTSYREGITVSTLLRPLKDKILASANMQQAFIIRKGQETQIMINLEKLLYGTDLNGDVALKPEDKIVIPYGSMYVFVTGEVTKSSWVGITGLTRLRDAVTPLLTRYSSIRDVKVKSADGYQKTFDLFKAERYGDLSQDPFLRPGDEIIISSLTNLVTIQGEVKRPGTYQLLPGEGLKELVSVYADGFTEKANTSRLTLLHYLSESSPVGEKIQFDYTKFPDMELRLYDIVAVPSLQELLPVAWFEGAVGLSSTGASPETSQRLAYTFVPGETVSQAAHANRKLFSAVSDLASAYIIHVDGSQTAVNLAKFIYDYDLTNDIQLRANDIIIVPFRQFFVTVSGAVHFPGRYPYIPNRTWEYYIGLAGGFDTDKNSGQKITIYDVKSNKVAIAGREIQPEDDIVAESNSFTYNMMKVSSILSTVLSLTVLIISLLGL